MAQYTVHDAIRSRNLPAETLLFITSETIRTIHELLSSIGIEFVVLKGPHLSHTIYAEPLQRTWCDLDILVKPSETGRALSCLRAHGFTPAPKDPRRTATEQSYYNINLMAPLGLPIELHHALASHHRYRVDIEQIMLDAESFSIMGVSAKGLKADHLLLHLCIHMMNDYFINEEKHLEDIALLLQKKPIQWEKFEVLAKRAGCTIGAYYALMAARIQKGASVPETLLAAFKPGFPRATWLNLFLDPRHNPIYKRKHHTYAKAMLFIGLPMMDRLVDGMASGFRYLHLRVLDFWYARQNASARV